MSSTSGDDLIVTSIRINKKLHKKAKLYAVSHNLTFQELVANALNNYMKPSD